MTQVKNGVPLRWENRVYAVVPDIRLVEEVEGELGGIAELEERFLCNRWEVSELVTLVQMMLQAAGRTVDYAQLGNRMLTEGLGHYLPAASTFLQRVLYAR